MKIYVYMEHFDGLEPIHAIRTCEKSVHHTLDKALKHGKERRKDFDVIFEIDTETLEIRPVY